MGKRRWDVLGGVALALVAAGAAVAYWTPLGVPLMSGAPVAWQPRPVAAEYNRAVADLIDQGQPPEGREPGAVNGYPLLIQAAGRYRREFTNVQQVAVEALFQQEILPHRDFPPEAELRAIGRESLARARQIGLLALLDQAVTAPRLARAMDGTPERAAQMADLQIEPARVDELSLTSFGTLPEAPAFRALIRLAYTRMTVAAGTVPWIGPPTEPDPAEFIAGVRMALGVSRALLHQESIDNHVRGQSLTRGSARMIMECLRFVNDDATLAAVAAAAEEHSRRSPTFLFSLSTEPAVSRVLADRLFTKWGRPDAGAWQQYHQLTSESDSFDASRKNLRWGTWGLSRAEFLEYSDALTAMIAAWWKTLPEDRGSTEAWERFANMKDRHVHLSVMRLGVTSLRLVVQIADEAALHLVALTTAVAVERYRIATGNYPADLSVVVGKGLLPAVPRDAIARAPLGYRRLDTPDAQGRPYLLYSIGADGVDDGAQRLSEDFGSERQSALFGPAPTPTVDVLLN